ncbi:unnamed protein product [Aphanomyces euteiches]
MTFFSTKQVDVWTGGYTRSSPFENVPLGYSGASAARLNDKALVVGGRDVSEKSASDLSFSIVFDMVQGKIMYDYDVAGSLSRRIGMICIENNPIMHVVGHAVAAVSTKNAWFVFGGEEMDDDGHHVRFGDVHRATFTKHVLRWEKMQPKGEEPSPRAWHTLTCIRYRPAQDVPASLKSKTQQPSLSQINPAELDEALLLLGGRGEHKDIWALTFEKALSADDGNDVVDAGDQALKWVKMNTEGTSPLPLACHTSQAISDGVKVVVVGGVAGNNSTFPDSVSILNVLTWTWSTLCTSPLLSRSGHVAQWPCLPFLAGSEEAKQIFPRDATQLIGNDCLIVFGGITPDGMAPLDSFLVVDVDAASVVEIAGDLALETYMGHAVVTSPDRRKLFVFGGTHATSRAWIDTTSCVDLWTYQHEPLPPPPLERMRTLEYPNGDVYLGEFDPANPIIRHGVGRCTYKNGQVYEGHWVQDAWEGSGRLEYTTGDVYEGDFQANERHGQGKLTRNVSNTTSSSPSERPVEVVPAPVVQMIDNGKRQRVFDGSWQEDRRHGQGTVEFTNGSKLKGIWANGELQSSTAVTIDEYVDATLVGMYEGTVDAESLPHGQGRFETKGYPKTGEMYSGGWLHGKRDGQGMSMQFDGTVFMGEWKNSKRNGWGTCDYAETRDRYEGKWVGDVRCGQGTCTYAAGYVYQGHWAFDKRHGDGRCTYKDGTFYEGHWENNEFCGDGALVL